LSRKIVFSSQKEEEKEGAQKENVLSPAVAFVRNVER